MDGGYLDRSCSVERFVVSLWQVDFLVIAVKEEAHGVMF